MKTLNQTKLFVVAALIVGIAAVPALTLAQQGGGQGGQRQGQRQGRPGGGPMGLLMQKDVQTELGLSIDQVEKLKAMRTGGFGGPPPAGGQPGGADSDPHAAMLKQLRTVLSDSQLNRFEQIELQAMGGRALLRPDVAEKLQLSEEQREKIQQIVGPMGGPGGFGGGQGGPPPQGGQGGFGGGQGGPPPQGGQGGFGGGQGGPPPQGGQGGFGGGQGGPPPQGGQGGFGGGQSGPPPQGGGQQAQITKKALAVLTSDQLKTWKAMIGKPFKLKMGPGGPGGQGGPPPGGPGGGGETGGPPPGDGGGL